MEKIVANYIKKNNLITPGAKVVIALSGGVDSMVLFDVLKKLGYQVIVAHVNHKIRLDSEIEEEYISSLCQKENIPYEVLHLEKIDKNFEAEAHRKRYSFFFDVCNKYNAEYLTTAHHSDDNIETIILNLMSGSNLYGYGGISNKRKDGNINIVRPLLSLSKNEIKDYARRNNIHYFEDYTNQSDDYTRNRIRHHVIPKLKDECPSILDKATSFSNQIHEAFDYIRSQSILYLKNNSIDVDSFNQLHPFLKKDIICLLLEQYEVERNENLINDLINIISSSTPQSSYTLKGGLEFKKRYQTCTIERKELSSSFNYAINSFDDVVDNTHLKVYLTKEKPINAIYLKLCYNDIVFPLEIRSRITGDEIEMAYGHKKIKEIFIDQKVPKELRESTPILVDGNGDILWVYNYAKSHKIAKYKDSYDCYLVLEVK